MTPGVMAMVVVFTKNRLHGRYCETKMAKETSVEMSLCKEVCRDVFVEESQRKGLWAKVARERSLGKGL